MNQRDHRAIETLRDRVRDLTIYEHAVPIFEGEIVVSLAQLVDAGVVESITINPLPR